MRIVAIAITLIATTAVAALSYSSFSQPSETESITTHNTYFTDVISTRDKTLLHQFVASLDPEIMRQCVAEQQEKRQMDLDKLATCGNFDIYAQYLRVSKFEAVKKFQHALLNSSSKLEFDDRLAR